MPCRREQQGTAAPRGSTWTKVFDLYDEGLTEHNYQAFTYDFTFHRLLTGEPLFWVSLAGLAVWLVAALVFSITTAQIKKYNERHERDNVIINESIETFTGFIDAKDP